jgi:putative membrane protein
MKRGTTLAFSVLIATLFLGAQWAPGADSKSEASKSKISEDDAQFAREAASGGMMEVQLGKVAQDRASNAQVKEFGSRMVKDHSKANDQLKKIASKKDIKLPTELEAKHKATVNKLSKLKGEEFDREYMSAMVDDHKEDLEKFQRQADKGKDPELKKFAQDHVPILKKHHELAEQTRKQAGSSKSKS